MKITQTLKRNFIFHSSHRFVGRGRIYRWWRFISHTPPLNGNLIVVFPTNLSNCQCLSLFVVAENSVMMLCWNSVRQVIGIQLRNLLAKIRVCAISLTISHPNSDGGIFFWTMIYECARTWTYHRPQQLQIDLCLSLILKRTGLSAKLHLWPQLSDSIRVTYGI